jgi:hypothetical protein
MEDAVEKACAIFEYGLTLTGIYVITKRYTTFKGMDLIHKRPVLIRAVSPSA